MAEKKFWLLDVTKSPKREYTGGVCFRQQCGSYEELVGALAHEAGISIERARIVLATAHTPPNSSTRLVEIGDGDFTAQAYPVDFQASTQIRNIAYFLGHKCICSYDALAGLKIKDAKGRLVYVETSHGSNWRGTHSIGRVWFDAAQEAGPWVEIKPHNFDNPYTNDRLIASSEGLVLFCSECGQIIQLRVDASIEENSALILGEGENLGCTQGLKMDEPSQKVYTLFSGGKVKFDPEVYRRVGNRAISFAREWFFLLEQKVIQTSLPAGIGMLKRIAYPPPPSKWGELWVWSHALRKLGRQGLPGDQNPSWTKVHWLGIRLALALGWRPHR